MVELIVMSVVHDRTAVILSGENGASFKDFAGFLRLGGANSPTLTRVRAFTKAFASIHVKQNDIVAKTFVAGDGASAAAFRVTRMAAGNDYLEPPRRLMRIQNRNRSH